MTEAENERGAPMPIVVRYRPTGTYEAVQFALEDPHPGVRVHRRPDGRFRCAFVISGELDEEHWDRIEPGDWLLTGGGRRLFAVPARDFERCYEQVSS